MDDSELERSIEAARNGQSEGYQALLVAYGSRLYGYFYRFTGDRDEAEDLLGEMMLRLVRTLGKYDERGRFEPWLFRIAANLVRDRIRRRKTGPVVQSLSVESEEGADASEMLSGKEDPVDRRLLLEEASEEVQAALATLDEATREMILLRHFGEMSFAEIAAELHCPVGTVLAKVHRGLKALRAKLEKGGGAK